MVSRLLDGANTTSSTLEPLKAFALISVTLDGITILLRLKVDVSSSANTPSPITLTVSGRVISLFVPLYSVKTPFLSITKSSKLISAANFKLNPFSPAYSAAALV